MICFLVESGYFGDEQSHVVVRRALGTMALKIRQDSIL
jgi:hypothetical protein